MDGHPCPPSRPCGAGLSETHHMSTNGVSLKPRARSRRRRALDAATARIFKMSPGTTISPAVGGQVINPSAGRVPR